MFRVTTIDGQGYTVEIYGGFQIPKSLLTFAMANADKIYAVECDSENGENGGRSYWVYIRDGFICEMSECGTIHEDTIAKVKDYFSSVVVEVSESNDKVVTASADTINTDGQDGQNTERGKPMIVPTNAAIVMFKALGFKTASKWSEKRLTTKLNQLGEAVDADTVIEGDKDATKTLTQVLGALGKGEAVELGEATAEAAAEKTPATPTIAKAKKKAKDKKDADKKKSDAGKVAGQKATAAADKKAAAKADAAKVKKDAADKKKADAEAKKKADKKAADADKVKADKATARKAKADDAATAKAEKAAKRVPGVQVTALTRPFYCGQVIKENGLKAGCTPAMVAEVDKRYGKANPVETLFCLRNTWHAIRGYLGVTADELTATTAPPAKAKKAPAKKKAAGKGKK